MDFKIKLKHLCHSHSEGNKETHRGADLSCPQPAGSQSDWPGQPRCMRSPCCSPSHWPTQEGQILWTGQSSEYWTGSGQAQRGKVGIHCWMTTEREREDRYMDIMTSLVWMTCWIPRFSRDIVRIQLPCKVSCTYKSDDNFRYKEEMGPLHEQRHDPGHLEQQWPS